MGCETKFFHYAAIGPFQTDQLGQRRRIAHIQTQGGVGGMVALSLAGLIVVIPLQLEVAEEALHPDGFPALAPLSAFGLIAGIGPIRGFLQQPANQRIGGFEHRRAHQEFQLGDALAVQLPGFKPGDQLLDFFFPGEEDRGLERRSGRINQISGNEKTRTKCGLETLNRFGSKLRLPLLGWIVLQHDGC